jgi:hypothetical protein
MLALLGGAPPPGCCCSVAVAVVVVEEERARLAEGGGALRDASSWRLASSSPGATQHLSFNLKGSLERGGKEMR